MTLMVSYITQIPDQKETMLSKIVSKTMDVRMQWFKINSFQIKKYYLISSGKSNVSKSHPDAFDTFKWPTKDNCVTDSVGYANISHSHSQKA